MITDKTPIPQAEETHALMPFVQALLVGLATLASANGGSVLALTSDSNQSFAGQFQQLALTPRDFSRAFQTGEVELALRQAGAPEDAWKDMLDGAREVAPQLVADTELAMLGIPPEAGQQNIESQITMVNSQTARDIYQVQTNWNNFVPEGIARAQAAAKESGGTVDVTPFMIQVIAEKLSMPTERAHQAYFEVNAANNMVRVADARETAVAEESGLANPPSLLPAGTQPPALPEGPGPSPPPPSLPPLLTESDNANGNSTSIDKTPPKEGEPGYQPPSSPDQPSGLVPEQEQPQQEQPQQEQPQQEQPQQEQPQQEQQQKSSYPYQKPAQEANRPSGGSGGGPALLVAPAVIVALQRMFRSRRRVTRPTGGGGGEGGGGEGGGGGTPYDLGYCGEPIDPSDSSASARNAIDGLCAAFSQLREDGGFERAGAANLERATGVSPFWQTHERRLDRTADTQDWWRTNIYPPQGQEPAPTPIERIADDVNAPRGPLFPRDVTLPVEGDFTSVAFALARGLCGARGPHQAVPADATSLRYTLPGVVTPAAALEKSLNLELGHPQRVKERHFDSDQFACVSATVVTKLDFVRTDGEPKPLTPRAITTDGARIAVWAPVKFANVTTRLDDRRVRRTKVPSPSTTPTDTAVCKAAALEHLIDYYSRRVSRVGASQEEKRLNMACRAVTKVLQLRSMGTVVAALGPAASICKACPLYPADDSRRVIFITRPVLRCPDGQVLYPCDPGLATFVIDSSGAAAAAVDAAASPSLPDIAYGARAGGLAGAVGRRRTLDRQTATRGMRGAIGEDAGGRYPMLYVAQPPGTAGPALETSTFEDRGGMRGAPDEAIFDNASDFSMESVLSSLRYGVSVCMQLRQLEAEQVHVETMRSEERSPAAASEDDWSRSRREAVWNDSLREQAITGDRLYAFVRQLSGTISEQVDSICQIDEGMVVRQQREIQDRRAKATEQAAREHMQLVRTVFSSVLRESGLTLGIDEGSGSTKDFKIVSNTLRKQAEELSKGTGSEGFFANSVRLEQLLTKGTGEMTLSDLFSGLRDAGRELQDAAFAAQPFEMAAGASLDFLSAPRNSLMLRYKPEALAAIRQSFDIFQREMLSQNGRMYRTVSAYELVEGNDEPLTGAFATFAAHMLVHSRMYSSATAMYVAAWPAAANAQQLKISLQRLVRIAAHYLAHTTAPNFLSPDGRKHYFAQPRASEVTAVPLMSMRYGPAPGLWGLNLYGNR